MTDADPAAARWEARWRDGDTPWDLGGPSPGLLVALEGPLGGATPLRVLVPGAGGGHDAIALARHGHDVTALDLSPTALATARQRAATAGVRIAFVEGDILVTDPARRARFDRVFEHTCFCAIEPNRRDDYVRGVAEALAPRGLVVAVLWQNGREGGPPFDVTPADVERHFGRRFVLTAVRDVPAGGRREGTERLHTFALAAEGPSPVA